ncbi:collectin-12-like [Cheilinus undulatus]|uniref:collectin-12-like n=1 Tax=Cheilinus undulatus TaxID=241271 RepID=UPI001BD32381|nr:collectin-12-like [Cheilinus undulatus]
MKLLTVSLLICVLIALAQAAALRRPRRTSTVVIDPRLPPPRPPPPPRRPQLHAVPDHPPWKGHDPSGHGQWPNPSGHGHGQWPAMPNGPLRHQPEAQGHSGEDQQYDDMTTIPTTVPLFPGGDYGPYYPGGDHGPYYPGGDYGPHGPDYPFPITQCKPGWKTYSARCLLYVPEKKTRSDAENFCQSEGGYLVAALKEQFSEDIDDVIKEAGPQIWVGGCTTSDPSWDYSIFDWMKPPSKPAYIKRTAEGWECVEAEPCKEKLPFICSITRM